MERCERTEERAENWLCVALVGSGLKDSESVYGKDVQALHWVDEACRERRTESIVWGLF